MQIQLKQSVAILAVASLLVGCFSNYNAIKNQKKTKATLEQITQLATQVLPYNSSSDSSTIYISVINDQLLYAKYTNEEELTAQLKVESYRLTSISNYAPLDTFTTLFTLPLVQYKRQAKITLTLKLPATPNFETPYKITITDVNRKNEAQHFVVLNKTNMLNRQNFILSTATQNPHFSNVYSDSTPITLLHNSSAKKIYARCFKTKFPIALPPFSMTPNATYKFIPDSSFTIVSNIAKQFQITMKQQGLYHLQLDSLKKEGVTLFKFTPDYPNVSNSKQLILPMRYILSTQEYDELLAATNPKEALDKVWLNIAGSANKARELIRAYYGRVKTANEKYTSYTEGWKTDRGMLYIVCGEPQTSYKNMEAETWIYGEENNFRSLNFAFAKVNNPFTNNDYELTRNALYRDYWYLAVDTWRSGKVFMNQ
ncbi:MAG: GWxTD domain-containing protein [Bacteroidia bacterium]|nr:GWxTD domain-containing protein [Bacteroidia bacterium]